jgi:hypothetical protein
VTTSSGREEEKMGRGKAIARVDIIQQRMLLIRGEKIIVDAELAESYGDNQSP